jgi:hypothetical protein
MTSDFRSEHEGRARHSRRIEPVRWRCANLILLTLWAIVPFEAGCMSIQVEDGNTGLPMVWGWGETSSIAVRDGTVTRLLSPGVSLRLHTFAPGLTLGWHETILFLPAVGSAPMPARPVAIQTRSYGLGLVPFGLIAGAERKFAVLAPQPGESVVQFVHFEQADITKTIVKKEGLP